MKLSIIITSYKNPELLKVCIDSIKKNYSGDDYEVIVVDSETEESIASMMREDYPDVIFFPSQKNLRFGGEVNKGIENSRGGHILILNDDIVIKKEAIENLLRYSQANPDVGVIGPQLLNFDDSLQPSTFRFYTPLTIVYRRTFLGKLSFAKKHLEKFLMKDFDNKKIQEVDWVMGSAMMIKKTAIQKVGPIDPIFKMYMEDTDWCRRFWENGYKVIYLPSAQMYHYHRRGSSGKNALQALLFNKLAWLHILSALKYFKKYAGKPLPKHN